MKKQLLVLVSSLLLLASCDQTGSSTPSIEDTGSSVKEDTKVASITLNQNSVELEIGETFQIEPTVLPNDATNKLVDYSSTDESIASVSMQGKVTAKKEGKTTINVVSDDNSEIKATLEVTVKAKAITAFDISFPEDVEEITSGNKKYKQLIAGKDYKLGFSFTPENMSGEIEVEFSVPEYASFDAATSTLTALKEISSLDITFSAKGTSLSKTINFKITTQGKSDRNIAYAKLEASAEKESKKNINSYSFSLISERRSSGVLTKQEETTNYSVYQNGQQSYMVGKKTKTVKTGSDEEITSKMTTFTGVGNDNTNYYELEINDETHVHEKEPVKKAITNNDEAEAGQITRADAKRNGSFLIHNSHVGLSEIAGAMVSQNNSGYDYFFSKSYPFYFGGEVANNATYETTTNGFKVKGYVIEEKPSTTLSNKGAVFFNEGEFVFNEESILTSVTVIDKVYDETGFDFTNKTLKENATPVDVYTIKYGQGFGDIGKETKLSIDTNDLYFDSFEVDVKKSANVINPKKLEVGGTYTFAEKEASPAIATSKIDPILLTATSNKEVIQVASDGLSFIVLKEGQAKLTFNSTKNNKEYTLDVSTTLPEATSLYIKRGEDGEIVKTLTAVTNEEYDGFYFTTYPSNAFETGTAPTFTYTDESGNATTSCEMFAKEAKIKNMPTFAFKATIAGTYTVTASYNDKAKASFKAVVKDAATGLISKEVIKHDFSYTDGDTQFIVHFNSETGGVINGYGYVGFGAVKEYIENDGNAVKMTFTCVFDNAKKTLTFTSVTAEDEDALSAYYNDYYAYTPQLNTPFAINDSGTELNGLVNNLSDEDPMEDEKGTLTALN